MVWEQGAGDGGAEESYRCRTDDRISETHYSDNALEVRELVGEYDFVAKQLYQMEDVTALMLELAQGYQTNEMIQKVQDSLYGDGTTAYIGQAIEAFYAEIK